MQVGRNNFHLSFIKISYRNRGYEPRIHNKVIVINIKINNDIVLFKELKNNIIDIILKIIILKYSARKIKANQPPIYSTLNPDTNSDSPSAKSKGLRLVSAKHVIIHIMNSNIFPKKKYNKFCDNEISLKEYEYEIIAINKIIIKKDTSYEIIWAILRIEPRWLYFEFADHPIKRIEYTAILDRMKNKRILCLLS